MKCVSRYFWPWPFRLAPNNNNHNKATSCPLQSLRTPASIPQETAALASCIAPKTGSLTPLKAIQAALSTGVSPTPTQLVWKSISIITPGHRLCNMPRPNNRPSRPNLNPNMCQCRSPRGRRAGRFTLRRRTINPKLLGTNGVVGLLVTVVRWRIKLRNIIVYNIYLGSFYSGNVYYYFF